MDGSSNQWFVAAVLFGIVGLIQPRLGFALIVIMGICGWIEWSNGHPLIWDNG